MEITAPYRLSEPAHLTSCAVFNSPHSGNSYPKTLIRRSRLDARRLRASEDALVDQLFASAPEFGAPLLSAVVPRAWIDLNRSPSELDPALIQGLQSTRLNQRIAAGLGVVPRIVAEGTAIYDGKISMDDVRNRIETCHKPYHARLETLIQRASGEFGTANLFDCHSMPTDALRAAPRVKGSLPDIVLGDRFGAAADREVAILTHEAFQAEGFTVARNAPFAGGYITQRYGRPSRHVSAIQIEIDRGIYLDQRRIEPLPEFAEVRRRISRVVEKLAAILPAGVAVAAE